MGLGSPDDSAVYRLNDEQAIISTTDFFPPVVDDPYAFGAIAAANALSDVYAMGGTPTLAINLVAFPDGLDLTILSEILRGGAEKVREAGAVIAGGHTVTDKEPKYGLSVTGIVHPDRIITKGGIQHGDVLVLTKRLGTGVITTALKRGQAEASHIEKAIAYMSRLNKDAAQLAIYYGAHAMTDITGYSLLGHAHEMAHLSQVDLVLDYGALLWIDGAHHYAQQDIFPGGMWRNHDYFGQWVHFDAAINQHSRYLMFDPQTSGGLLIAVSPAIAEEFVTALIAGGDEAAIIGSAIAGHGNITIKP